jgi:hypothetical protein
MRWALVLVNSLRNGKFQKQIYLLNDINANELTGRIIPSGIYRPSADFYY